MDGPDHPFAIEPGELRRSSAASATSRPRSATADWRAPATRRPSEMYTLARRSVIAAVAIPAGTVITEAC